MKNGSYPSGKESAVLDWQATFPHSRALDHLTRGLLHSPKGSMGSQPPLARVKKKKKKQENGVINLFRKFSENVYKPFPWWHGKETFFTFLGKK